MGGHGQVPPTAGKHEREPVQPIARAIRVLIRRVDLIVSVEVLHLIVSFIGVFGGGWILFGHQVVSGGH